MQNWSIAEFILHKTQKEQQNLEMSNLKHLYLLLMKDISVTLHENSKTSICAVFVHEAEQLLLFSVRHCVHFKCLFPMSAVDLVRDDMHT